MKKILFILATIVALAFTSCDKNEDKGLEGTRWVYRLEASTTNWVNISLAFNGNGTVDMTAEYRFNSEYEQGSQKGSYTYVAPNVTLTFSDGDGGTIRMTGTVMDNKMLLRESDDPQEGAIAFIRQ